MAESIQHQLSECFDIQHLDNLGQLDRRNCSLVLLFHSLPLHCCLPVLQELSSSCPALPVLILAEPVGTEDAIEMFRYGAKDVLFLPVEQEMLLNCIFRHLPTDVPAPGSFLKIMMRRLASIFAPQISTAPASLGLMAQPPLSRPEKNPLPPSEAPVDLKIQMLGKFQVFYEDRPLPRFRGKKTKALLAYILHKYPKPVHRDVLIDRFWGESTQESARNCLNVTIHAIRKCLEKIAPGQEIIVFQDDSYGVHPSLKVEKDTGLFESYWKKSRSIEQEHGMAAAIDAYHQAFAFYKGDFLEDMPYEDWTERERERYKETWLIILDRLSAHFFKEEKYQICLNLSKRMLEKDPCLEEAHRRLMACYQELGMRDRAIRQFMKCEDSLKEELNVAPGKATTDLYERILEH